MGHQKRVRCHMAATPASPPPTFASDSNADEDRDKKDVGRTRGLRPLPPLPAESLGERPPLPPRPRPPRPLTLSCPPAATAALLPSLKLPPPSLKLSPLPPPPTSKDVPRLPPLLSLKLPPPPLPPPPSPASMDDLGLPGSLSEEKDAPVERFAYSFWAPERKPGASNELSPSSDAPWLSTSGADSASNAAAAAVVAVPAAAAAPNAPTSSGVAVEAEEGAEERVTEGTEEQENEEDAEEEEEGWRCRAAVWQAVGLVKQL
mmetsp:Transcript_73420/g.147855  ORF Transcript_73420/g.147855 Transcript_73420/m.147855 type:complete len:261 (+) Transcript_73420:69-851(+)